MTAVRQKPIVVLHLRDSPWIDGPGRTILETAAHIDRSRVDYHIGALVADASSPHPLVDAARKRGLPVHRIVDAGDSLSAVVSRVVALMDELDVEILHTSEFRSNVIGLLCRRKRSVKLVSTVHGWIANDWRGRMKTILDRVLLKAFDRIILVSSALGRSLPTWWLPASRVTVLRNALVLGQYGEGNIERERVCPRPGDQVKILNVGRLSAEKGQALLLEAFAALAFEFPTMQLCFAGIGPLEPELKCLAKDLGISGRVQFLGYVADMPGLYSSVDLVVQSSFTEGLPNVILEALYLGVPVVATDVGGTREVVEHDRTGWLVSPQSAEELSTGLRAYLECPEKFTTMAASARPYINSRFGIIERTAGQAEVYEQLAGVSQ